MCDLCHLLSIEGASPRTETRPMALPPRLRQWQHTSQHLVAVEEMVLQGADDMQDEDADGRERQQLVSVVRQLARCRADSQLRPLEQPEPLKWSVTR